MKDGPIRSAKSGRIRGVRALFDLMIWSRVMWRFQEMSEDKPKELLIFISLFLHENLPSMSLLKIILC